jgi:hypothetical protein
LEALGHEKKKRIMRRKIIFLLAAAVNCCDGFVVPFRRSIVVVDRHSSNPVVRHQSSTIRRSSRRLIVVIASSKNDNNEDKEEDVTSTIEDNAPIFNTNVSERSNNSSKDGPSTLSRITFSIYQLFSYCLQVAGAFFFIGLLLNFAGFGYTFDMEHGLVIDKIQNIRNTVQFEMEIKREEREDVMMKAGSSSSSSSGAVGSTKLFDSSFRE